MKLKGLLLCITLLFVGAVVVGGLYWRISRRDCVSLTAHTYKLYFDWRGTLATLHIVDPQNEVEVSSNKIRSVVWNAVVQELGKIAASNKWTTATGTASISVAGCDATYIAVTQLSDYRIPQLSEFMTAAELWDLKKLQDILATDVNVNERDLFGRTALMYAATDPRKELKEHPEYLVRLHSPPDIRAVRLLLDSGADPNATDKFGLSVLMLSDSSTADLLLSAGANVNGRDNLGKTPLMYAVQRNDLALLLLELARGADARASDRNGWTALMYATDQGSTEAMKILRAASGNPVESDRGGGGHV